MMPETDITTKPYRLAAGEGVADVWCKTGRMTVKAGSAETGKSFAQLEMNDPRGTATPMHVHHNEDETFYALEGEILALVGDERITLSAGDFAFAPRGVPHATVVSSERARVLVTTSPGASRRAVRLARLDGDCKRARLRRLPDDDHRNLRAQLHALTGRPTSPEWQPGGVRAHEQLPGRRPRTTRAGMGADGKPKPAASVGRKGR